MYKRYYDGYQGNTVLKNQGEIVIPQTIGTENENCVKAELASPRPQPVAVADCGCKKGVLNLPFELDDLILIGILIFLLFDKDDCKKDDDNDIFMLLIVGLILFSDIF